MNKRNSFVDIYKENTILRKTQKLLGQDVETDEWLECRVKWCQRGTGVSGVLGLMCWIGGQNVPVVVFAAFVLVFFCVLYYKNISFVIAKRLLRESNVVFILLLSLCNFSIDIARSGSLFAPILGALYVLLVSAFVFLDAVKLKSRVFMVVVGILFVLVNISNIYNLVFGDWDQGIVLLKYTTHGNEYTFMKRSTKRNIFIQIMLFSMSGIHTLLKDRKQEYLIFATGNIYRETGTASKTIEDKEYSRKITLENAVHAVV